MPTVLLTGFKPFAGDTENPTERAVREVASRWNGESRLVAEVLPVEFEGAAVRLRALIDEHSPDVIICTGLAANRDRISVERVAVNLIDAPIADNAGHQPRDTSVIDGAPAAYFATLPVKAIVAAVAASGIPAGESLSAGSYVCNTAMYTVLDAAASHTKAGFVHVPFATDTNSPNGITPSDIAAAIETAIAVSLAPGEAVVSQGGAVS